jgi:RNA polymerase sigma-70 factor (ECF subfamily)
MSEGDMPLHSPTLPVAPSLKPVHESDAAVAERDAHDALGDSHAQPWTFDAVYHRHAAFVWRNASRLGVPPSVVEDVMQEVFLVVHRRLPEFEERTSVRAWLSAILIRVVRAHRRVLRRKDVGHQPGSSPVEPDAVCDVRSPSPLEAAERDETVRELYAILSQMNDERREVLVLAELEGLTVPEIADALQVNINTVYWRLRTGRKEFERILFRRRATEARSLR